MDSDHGIEIVRRLREQAHQEDSGSGRAVDVALSIIEQSGHHIMLDDPGAFNAAVLCCVAGEDAEAGRRAWEGKEEEGWLGLTECTLYIR